MVDVLRGLLVADGTSDEPLAEIVERLFLTHGITVAITVPDWGALSRRVPRDVSSRLNAGSRLMSPPPDLVVVHRDAESSDAQPRLDEITRAIDSLGSASICVPVVPVRMTEAWLLLDEQAIRRAAGNPNGRTPLPLPGRARVEAEPDPKAVLEECLCLASGMRGRRLKAVRQAFNANRRRLLETLDIEGPVTHLRSWQQLQGSVEGATGRLRA